MRNQANKLTSRFGIIFSLALITNSFISSPVMAQSLGYNYRIGDSRIQQGHNGLAGTGGTYITNGTLSRSAQAAVLPMPTQFVGPQGSQPRDGVCGISNGASNNGGLQMARLGSTVGAAGDYMRSDLNPNFNLQRQQQQPQMMRRNQHQMRQPVIRQPQVNYTTYGTASGHYQAPASGGAANYGSSSGSGYRGY